MKGRTDRSYARLGFTARHVQGQPGLLYVIQCKVCPLPFEWQSPRPVPVEVLRHRFATKGWQLGKRVLCPDHFHSPRERKNGMPKESPMATAITAAAEALNPPAAPAAPCDGKTAAEQASDRARAAKRTVMQWLDEAFNIERGQYRAGISDATIAKEAGLAEAAVKALREDFYGPLKQPREIEHLKAETLSMREKVNRSLVAMQTEIDALDAKLGELASKNGWLI